MAYQAGDTTKFTKEFFYVDDQRKVYFDPDFISILLVSNISGKEIFALPDTCITRVLMGVYDFFITWPQDYDSVRITINWAENGIPKSESILARISKVNKKLVDITSPVYINSNNDERVYIAGNRVSAYRLVYISASNTVSTASSDNVLHADRVIGFAMNEAVEGGRLIVKKGGLIICDKWNLQAGESYFVGINGNISPIPPESGFIQKVGIADDRTTLNIMFSEAILV